MTDRNQELVTPEGSRSSSKSLVLTEVRVKEVADHPAGQGFGDISENFEHDDAKTEQVFWSAGSTRSSAAFGNAKVVDPRRPSAAPSTLGPA